MLTYGNIAQYPVFPWVLADYSSPTLDLTGTQIYLQLLVQKYKY